MLLYYIRHGAPTYDPDMLTPLGRRQAESVGKYIASENIDRIFSSSSNRAVETATPAAEMLKKEINILDFTNEKYAWKYFHVKSADGITKWADQCHEYITKFAGSEILSLGYNWYEHPDLKDTQFKDGIDFMYPQIDDFISSLGYEHDREKHLYNVKNPNDKKIALFAHAGFGGVFLSSVLDIPYPQICTHFLMGHTGVTVIEFSNKEKTTVPRILSFSNNSHLSCDRLPITY